MELKKTRMSQIISLANIRIRHFHTQHGTTTVYRIGTSELISVVIPVREGLPANLECILDQTFRDFEVIVVSGAGAPSSATARNVGIRMAAGEFIVFLDDDAYPKQDWLENLLKAYEDSKGDIIDSFEVMTRSARFSCSRFDQSHLQYLEEKSTCNFALYPRRVFECVGFFDEYFKGAGFDDMDFSIRLRKKGFKIRHCSQAVVEHRSEPRSFRSFISQRLFYFFVKHPVYFFLLLLAYFPITGSFWKRHIFQNPRL